MDIVNVNTNQAYKLHLRNQIHLKKLNNLNEFSLYAEQLQNLSEHLFLYIKQEKSTTTKEKIKAFYRYKIS